MNNKTTPSWEFTNSAGDFRLENPQRTSYLYFPLVNEAGMMSAITPALQGDAKTSQHTFLLPPVSVEDLHNSRSARNFWLTIDGAGAWSATGNSAVQIAEGDDGVTLDAGFLWHRVTRTNMRLGLRVEITSIVPPSDDAVELMRVSFINDSDHTIKFTPTAAIPIYGRSADNLRDHRHVTSLLHRITCETHGVLVKPVLSFDERGHHANHTTYAVLGAEGDGAAPIGFFPVVEDFIGEGGNLEQPAAVLAVRDNYVLAGHTVDGYEAMGGLRFRDVTLHPGQSCACILILGILADHSDVAHLVERYGSAEKFETWLENTKAHWQHQLVNLDFNTGDPRFNLWLRWVSVQPTLRRLFGNSFVPYHDYGRGGRGWRDLWQDILSLMVMETGPVDHLLIENFAGVRLDGSNATIIGSRPGEFKADRNNIPRVWMDHGAWPFLTTQLYIHQTGDLEFLLRDQAYFKDRFIERTQAIDGDWAPAQGTCQLTTAGEPYLGSVLEHLLVQHLTAFYNVGEHNQIRLEGADWNDGMDMAPQRGESVAFTAMYAGNLRQLGQLVLELHKTGVETAALAAEILPLLDTLGDAVDYNSIPAKRARLKKYFAGVQHALSGQKVQLSLAALASNLLIKGIWMADHIRAQEWITDGAGNSWFNGYYNNEGQPLEGDHPSGVRMTLTGQVFTLLGGVATDAQASAMIKAVDRHLFDPAVGGYRLNTDFKEMLANMGRCFGYAFGHKENGAVFSHMTVMYAYALYERGYAREAYRALNHLYHQSTNFADSRMFPGIPEYFSARGRGMYPYLTGSASWYLLTMLTQAFGVRGASGDLVLAPQLVREQFGADGTAGVQTWFAGRQLRVAYQNPGQLDYGDYAIKAVFIDGKQIEATAIAGGVCISRSAIVALDAGRLHIITVQLGGDTPGIF